MIQVVFVHLGKAPARHLWLNIKRLKNLFPDIRMTVIYSEDTHLKKIIRAGAVPFLYKSSRLDEEMFKSMSLNQDFRQGFWRFSLERLIALEDFHRAIGETETIFHLESDILLMPNFPWLELVEKRKLTWLRFNDSHDVSAILISPNFTETNWLVNQIRRELKSNNRLTDMTILSLIRNKNAQRVDLLPTLKDSIDGNQTVIFDGAALGMWLTGRDPRNHLGVIERGLALPEAFDDASELVFSNFRGTELEVLHGNQKVVILNLHIHSKNTHLFGKNWITALRIDILRSRQKNLQKTFSLLAFFSLVKDFIRRNKFQSFSKATRAALKLIQFK
jgi:hypothetical protein